MFTESNFDYLQRVTPDKVDNPYIQKRIGQFHRQIDELRHFANSKQGQVHDKLMDKIVNYESLLDRLESR